MKITFTKLQGLGNDFVLIDDLEKPPGLVHHFSPEQIRLICDRHFGVGCDQMIRLRSLDSAVSAKGAPIACRVEFFNADGSNAEMCGNGIRAAAHYLVRHQAKVLPGDDEHFVCETLAGLIEIERVTKTGEQDDFFSVNMGRSRLDSPNGWLKPEELILNGKRYSYLLVQMGVPHCVIFGASWPEKEVRDVGPVIEIHPRFLRQTNVDFVEVLSRGKIRVQVWERGAGYTLACGTGACASVVAAIQTGQCDSKVEVELPGGVLQIEFDGDTVTMVGPAKEVFRGEIDIG